MKYFICFLLVCLLTGCGTFSQKPKPISVAGDSLSDDVSGLLSYHLNQPVKPANVVQQPTIPNNEQISVPSGATTQSAAQTEKPTETSVTPAVTSPVKTEVTAEKDIVQVLIDNERWIWLLWTCMVIYASKIYFKKTGKSSEALDDIQATLTEHMGVSQKLIAWFFRKFVWARKIKDKMFKPKSTK